VVGVALGYGFTLAATDAGAVLSFGFSREGGLGHGSLTSMSDVLPRRIEALAQMRRRFVAVAAGFTHALALTEKGELYGWGNSKANGHGREERTPHRVAALIGQRVKLVNARFPSSCVVTEKGELFIWGLTRAEGNLGHEGPQATPKRVARLSGVEVAAVAIGWTHTLAADVYGVVWAFGQRSALGLGASGAEDSAAVPTPTPIPTLRVRVLNSP
jgi:alpha-tubulin suppressor-like RCC1 family protein